MSGTSLDGLDLCLASFSEGHPDEWSFEILATRTISYNDTLRPWKKILEEAYEMRIEDLDELNAQYAAFLGSAAREFLDDQDLEADLLCSHGHTILHQPERGITYQLGNHPDLSRYSGLRSVGDFRRQDVELGGQGAPLVPIGDTLLFNEYSHCLNLGGFCNVSFDQDGVRSAFDISPCNMLLNDIAGLVGLPYDEGGQLARSGKTIKPLLDRWNNLEYYRMDGPRSLGREWYTENFSDLSSLSHQYDPKDLASTATEHIALQIAKVICRSQGVLITGGGAHNQYLLERLGEISGAGIKIPETQIVDFKEALIFAFLGVLKVRERINVLSSVTGAKEDHCSGVIYLPE